MRDLNPLMMDDDEEEENIQDKEATRKIMLTCARSKTCSS